MTIHNMVAKIRGIPANLVDDYNEIVNKINKPYELYIVNRTDIRLDYKEFTICVFNRQGDRYAFKHDINGSRITTYMQYRSEIYRLAKV